MKYIGDIHMKAIQIGQLKSAFSSILKEVKNNGETYIIEYGKKHQKIAMIVPYKEKKKKRIFGQLNGQAIIPDNFDDECNEINELFYGDTQ